MSIRSTAGAILRSTLGGRRTERLRRREVALRQKLSRRVAPPETPTPPKAAPVVPAKPPEKKPPTRQEQIDALAKPGTDLFQASLAPAAGLKFVSPDPSEHQSSGLHKHSVLAMLHQLLNPRTYFEIGVDRGQSLTLSRARSIAVDPGYRINRSIQCDVHTFLQTSDDFFATPGNFDHLEGVPVDLAFLDGMHLAEFALRDFMNTERQMSRGGVIVVDDMLPRNSLEAYRIRRTVSWAGDPYKLHRVLVQYRPDLTILPVNTEPTGSYLVLGLDPTSTVLDEAYDDILADLTSPDPQEVDPDWLRRVECYEPVPLLASPVWAEVRALRDRDAAAEEYADLWRQLCALR